MVPYHLLAQPRDRKDLARRFNGGPHEKPNAQTNDQGDMNQMATSPNSTGKIGNFITLEAKLLKRFPAAKTTPRSRLGWSPT